MMNDRPSAAWRRLLWPLGALLLSGLLLFTGLSALRAQAAEFAVTEERGNNAPLKQEVFDYSLSVGFLPPEGLQVSASDNRLNVTIDGHPFPISNLQRVVSLNIPLPNGISWNPSSPPGWTCYAPTDRISCDRTRLITETANLLFNVIVSPDVNPIASINARLIVTDSNPLNNNYPFVITINSADLELSKKADPQSVSENGEIRYTLTITNNGPNTTHNVIVVDPPPASNLLTFDSIANITPGTSFSQTTGLWQIPFLDIDGKATIDIIFDAQDGASGRQINNTAEIDQSLNPDNDTRYDWITTNNSASASIVVGGLEIDKTITVPNGSTDPITATVGEPISVLINVSNPTTSDVTGGFTITENIPIGLEPRLPLQSGGRWDATTRVMTVRRTSLAANQTFPYEFIMVGSASLDFEEQFTNVATVSWGSPQTRVDSNPVTFTVVPGGSLHVTKTDNLSQVYAGAVYSYTITVTNTGNVQVNQVVLTDTMVSNLYATGVALGGIGSGNCSSHTFCRVTLNDSLSPGEKATFRVGVRVLSGAAAGSNAVNSVVATGRDAESGAWISSTATDSNLVLATPPISMRITKDVTPIEANVGGTLTFRIDVRNTGANPVTNVIITDEFVAGLDLVSATTTRGTATLNTGARTLEVTIGSLGAGDRATIVVTTRVNSTVTVAQVYRNSAFMTWSPGAGEDRSNIVPFRLLPGSALPGTGLTVSGTGGSSPGAALAGLVFAPPVSDPAQGAAGGWISGGLGLLALGLGLLAILLLAYGLWARLNRPLYAGRAARAGLALIILALVCGVGAVLLRPSQATPDQLASLAGEKPPLATGAPVEPQRPTPTHRLPGPAQETAPAGDQPMLETRPTDAALAPTLEPLPTELAHLAPTPTPSVLPDFPIPTPTALPSTGPDGGPPDASAVTRIVIPAINLDTVVKYVPFSGYTWLIGGLKQEVAWMGDTSWPGLGGNTGLAGHVDLVDGSAGPFWDLRRLKAGDLITLYTQQKVYTYRVREQRVVADTDMSVIAATSNPQLTLITCTDWSTELRSYLQRLVVFAEFVQVQAQ